jgi:DhnA family fructose-bisphosphate aldolase class Ia
MTKPRLNRFLAKDGKCFDVAIDHGFFGEPSFLDGIHNMEHAIKTVVKAAPDAIQLSVGQAPILQGMPGKNKPALVLRTDVANVYGKELPAKLFSLMIEDTVEQALRLDAACLCINLFMLPNQPEVHAICIANINKLKPMADRYGMPMMVEPLVMQNNKKAGGYMVDGNLKKIKAMVRQAVELGADVIKADPCDNPEEYAEVIEVAGRIPVLVRGGGKVSDEELFSRTETIMKTGAKGIVYGRNVIQHPTPSGMTKALMAMVHKNANAKEAMEILKGE